MQRLIYIIVYPILWLISILPLQILYIKSTVFFFLIYHVIGYRKKVVKDNLALVFPEKTQAERDRIAKESFKHLCDIIVETIKAFSISEKEIGSRFVFTNLEVLDPYYTKNRSILLMT